MSNNVYQPVGKIIFCKLFSCFCGVLFIAQNSQVEGFRMKIFHISFGAIAKLLQLYLHYSPYVCNLLHTHHTPRMNHTHVQSLKNEI